jgi:hypothetical protein
MRACAFARLRLGRWAGRTDPAPCDRMLVQVYGAQVVNGHGFVNQRDTFFN